MTSLAAFAAHCRTMATAEHKPECPSLATPRWSGWRQERVPPPSCRGCLSDADRDLFAQMAGEVDDYLAEHLSVDLFGESGAEPTQATDESEGR